MLLQHVRSEHPDKVINLLMTAGAMGRANDSMAVVDTKGRVFGVRSLRVVDSSIFAFLPPGHPQATACKS